MTPTTKTDEHATTSATASGAALPVVVDTTVTPATAGGEKTVDWFDNHEWDGVDDGDLAPPEESLLPLIPMNRKNGEGLVDPTTGEKTDTLTFVLLARMMTRAWWARSFDNRDGDGEPPSCRSADGVTGIGTFGAGSEHNPSGKCSTCPMNTWDTPTIGGEPFVTDDKGTVARPCNASYEAMVGVPNTTDGGVDLCRLRFNGLAFGPFRTFWNTFTKRVPKIAPIGFLSRMHLEPTDTKNGKFLVPAFNRVQPLTRADVEPLIRERDRYLDDFRRLVAEDAATRTADIDEQDHRTSGPAAGVSTSVDPNEPF